RANMVNALKGVTTPPPEVEVTSPEWFAQVDPSKDFAVDGRVWARGAEYSCKVYAAPGGYPGVNDFYELPSPVCNGTPRSAPVDGDPLPMHPGSPAVRSGAVSAKTASAFLASPSVGDLDHDGVPELVAADMEGKVYVWEPDGRRARRVESEVRYSGRPLHPFEN